MLFTKLCGSSQVVTDYKISSEVIQITTDYAINLIKIANQIISVNNNIDAMQDNMSHQQKSVHCISNTVHDQIQVYVKVKSLMVPIPILYCKCLLLT